MKLVQAELPFGVRDPHAIMFSETIWRALLPRMQDIFGVEITAEMIDQALAGDLVVYDGRTRFGHLRLLVMPAFSAKSAV